MGISCWSIPRVNKVLLFDLENDPNEVYDLSDDPEQADRVKNLFADLTELQEEMEDPLKLSIGIMEH